MMVVFDDMFGLVDRGTPGVRSGAVVADVVREVAWLEGMVTTLSPALRSHNLIHIQGVRALELRGDLMRDWRWHRAWQFAQEANEHHAQRATVHHRLALLCPCYALVAAAQERRRTRVATR